MKTITKIVATISVVVAMMLLATLPIFAATPNVGANVTKEELEPGDTFVLTIGSDEMTVTSFVCGVRFDTNVLEVTKRSSTNLTYYDVEEDEDVIKSYTARATAAEANANGSLGITFAGTADVTYNQNTAILTITFKVKDGARGTTQLTIFEKSDGTDGYNADVEVVTLTIGSSEPSCDHQNKTYTYEANGDKTHKVKCECGEYKIENERCYDGDGSETDPYDHYCNFCEAQIDGHEGGTATCTSGKTCTTCGAEYGEKDPSNHTKNTHTYENNNNGTDHKKKYGCCGATAVANEAHNFDDGDCVCGQAKPIPKYTLTFIVEGNTFWTTTGEDGSAVDYSGMPDTAKLGYTFAWDSALPATFAENKEITGTYIAQNGWTKTGDAWYYFTNGTPAKGVTRVPYPTEAINGVTYKANAEDLTYADYKDATEACFYFDKDGKFVAFTGVEADPSNVLRYFKNGQIVWHPGFVTVDEKLYYFVGDVEKGGNKAAEGQNYVTRNCEANGYKRGDQIVFENGLIKTSVDGIVDGYYYNKGKLMIGAGLVEFDTGKYIYVRSTNGKVVKGEYWVTVTNDIISAPKMFTFGDDYFMTVKDPTLNGIKDGYYYVDGMPEYAGLIEIKGEIYYVKSNGQLATGKYYVTKTNGMAGFVVGQKYTFGADGALVK